MQQIYMRTPMPKCDFNKVAKQIDNGNGSLYISFIYRIMSAFVLRVFN